MRRPRIRGRIAKGRWSTGTSRYHVLHRCSEATSAHPRKASHDVNWTRKGQPMLSRPPRHRLLFPLASERGRLLECFQPFAFSTSNLRMTNRILRDVQQVASEGCSAARSHTLCETSKAPFLQEAALQGWFFSLEFSGLLNPSDGTTNPYSPAVREH